jgi:N-acetylneuraminic acid mutarotase
MQRGSAATVGEVSFFNPGNTNTVYAYENYSQDWKELPTQCPHYSFTLVAINGVLTAVGGNQEESTPGNSLLSFAKGEWTEVFPPMTMQRSSPAAVCTGQYLVVAGGCSSSRGENSASSVEIMNTDTQQWHTATTNIPLPESYERIATPGSASMVVCGDKIYMFEGDDLRTHVYTCSLSSLLQPRQQSSDHTPGNTDDDAHTTWNRVVDLPVSQSTPVALCGRLLSIGGYSDTKEVDTVHYYEATTDTWQKMGNLICPQGLPLAATLPGDKLIVVHSNNNESFVGTSSVVEVS